MVDTSHDKQVIMRTGQRHINKQYIYIAQLIMSRSLFNSDNNNSNSNDVSYAVPLLVTSVVMLATTAAISMLKKDKSFGTLKDPNAGTASAQREAASAAAVEETWDSHVVEQFGELQEIWPNTLYTLEAQGCLRGPPRRNMHIYRVPNKKKRQLVIFNGIAVNDTTMQRIEQELGTPTILVVPNVYHRCCAAVWKRRYPNLKVVTPACAVDKVSQVVAVDCTTQAWAQQPEWAPYVHAMQVEGWGDFETVLEFELLEDDDKKKALVVCDMFFTMPYPENAGLIESFMTWMFDSCITLPKPGQDTMIVPKVARLSRIFGIQDWTKAEQWWRDYAVKKGPSVAAILVGHGVPIHEKDASVGCTPALQGIADQLVKKRW